MSSAWLAESYRWCSRSALLDANDSCIHQDLGYSHNQDIFSALLSCLLDKAYKSIMIAYDIIRKLIVKVAF